MKSLSLLVPIFFLFLNGCKEATPPVVVEMVPIEDVAEIQWRQTGEIAMVENSENGLTLINPAEEGYQSYHDLAFANDQEGIVVGSKLRVRATHDGGAHLQESLFSRLTQNFTSADYVNGRFFVVGDSKYLFSSTDGVNWQVADTSALYDQEIKGVHYLTVRFRDDLNGVVTGIMDREPVLLVTHDGGKHWQKQEISGIKDKRWPINAIAFVSETDWVMVTDGGEGYRSHDGGKKWQRMVAFDGMPTLRAIAFSDADHGCIGGTDRNLWCTQDGGDSWNPLLVPSDEPASSVSALQAINGQIFMAVSSHKPLPNGCFYRLSEDESAFVSAAPVTKAGEPYLGRCHQFEAVGDELYLLDGSAIYPVTVK